MTSRLAGVGAVTVAIGALLLSGCGTSAGTALVVNGTSYSESDVRTATEQINTNFDLDPAWTPGQIVGRLTVAQVLIDASAQMGSPQSAGAAESLLTRVTDPNPVTVLLVQADVARAVVSKGDATSVLAAVKRLKISVNPRYGTFDSDNVSLTPSAPDWVVATPAAAQTQEPPAQP